MAEKTKTEEIIITEENVKDIVNRFYENNENKKMLDKLCSKDKDALKAYILSNSIADNTIETDIAKVNVIPVTKQSFKENELIEFLKPLEIPGLIEYKPVINLDALQDALYHGDINPADIAPYTVEDVTYRVDVKKVKSK